MPPKAARAMPAMAMGLAPAAKPAAAAAPCLRLGAGWPLWAAALAAAAAAAAFSLCLLPPPKYFSLI